MHLRQEVLNVLLAQLLERRGLVAVPEQVLRRASTTHMPDVLVDCQGLRLAIEAEYGKDTPAANNRAKRKAYQAACERVDQAISHIGMAVIYPRELGELGFDQVKKKLEQSRLEFAIVTEPAITRIGDQSLLFPLTEAPGFQRGNVDDLADALRRSYEQLVRDEVLEQAVSVLQQSIERYLESLQIQSATSERIMGVLSAEGSPPTTLKPKERAAVNRISALIIVNAMIFQEVLAQHDSRVKTLQSLRGSHSLASDLLDHWNFILDNINYMPVFRMAAALIGCVAAGAGVNRAFGSLVEAALKVVGWRASLRHDLAGRIYHRLLEEAKYLGAYYTAIPSATLLLKLALRPANYECDWSDPSAIAGLCVGDLACGTGTLLMAAADTIIDNHIRACAHAGISPRLRDVNRSLVESVIYGYDVLPSAVHLTASTLTLRVPDSPSDVAHLYRVPLGGPEKFLGSLEFLGSDAATGTLFGRPEQVTGKRMVRKTITLPDFDLCTMNPPFTSSRQPNLLFGNVIGRKDLQDKLKAIVRREGIETSITAGLGAVFTALGDKHLKPHGRLALVLPRSVLNGIAWRRNREKLAKDYHLTHLFVSHEADHWNFSENTDLSEAMLIAQRRTPMIGDEKVVCVNFWRQPRTPIEALAVASVIAESPIPDLHDDQGCLQIKVGEHKLGEAVTVSWAKVKETSWNYPCAFAQSELLRVFWHLLDGRLRLPGTISAIDLPLIPLTALATLGPDPRDVYDGFELANGVTPYPALWGHAAGSTTTMAQTPTQYLSPLSEAKKGRPLRKLTDLWPKASRFLIAQRPWMKTKSVLAVIVSEKVLGDVWCPIAMRPGLDMKAMKALTVWLNCTLGIILLLGHREETRGAWIQFKKPELQRLPVPDLKKLPAIVLALAKTYDELSERGLLPFPEMTEDPARAAIDSAVARAFHLPDFSELRRCLRVSR